MLAAVWTPEAKRDGFARSTSEAKFSCFWTGGLAREDLGDPRPAVPSPNSSSPLVRPVAHLVAGSRRRSRRRRGRPRRRSAPRSRFCCREPTVTAGVPRNAPSRSAAEELPTMQAQCAISRTKPRAACCGRSGSRGSAGLAEQPDALRDLLGARVDVRPEDERLHPEGGDGLERRVDLLEASPYSVVTGCCIISRNGSLGVDRRACAAEGARAPSGRERRAQSSRRGRSTGSRR